MTNKIQGETCIRETTLCVIAEGSRYYKSFTLDLYLKHNFKSYVCLNNFIFDVHTY